MWTEIICAIGAILSALAGWVAAIVICCQGKYTRIAVISEMLLRWDVSFFYDRRMLHDRRMAAKYLLRKLGCEDEGQESLTEEKEGEISLSRVLDFFEGIASLVISYEKVFDKVLVWHFFGYYMLNYYYVAREFIKKEQNSDPTIWAELTKLAEDFRKIEKEKGGALCEEPTRKAMCEFLIDETNLGSRGNE